MPAEISRLYSFVNDASSAVPITASRIDGEFDQLIAAANQTAIIKATAPSSPINGMLWYDSTNKILKMYRNNEWVAQGIIQVGASAPATPQEGDLFYSTSADTLSVYNGTAQLQIYPSTPTGSIVGWATGTAPSGWLLCDGTEVSRTTYASLFTVISTAYGTGDGSTTFNVPNAKGSVFVGLDAGQTEFNALAKTGGEKTHTLTVPEMPAHTHTIGQRPAAGSDAQSGTPAPISGTFNSGSTGGDGAHNNLQPYLVINYIIKA